MTDELINSFDELSDLIRHPSLELSIFSSDLDSREDENLTLAPIEDPIEHESARRRRGALMFSANLIFDQVIDDIAVLLGAPIDDGTGESFVDNYFPDRYRSKYDVEFHRKLLATVAKVAHDLAMDTPSSPACTAEELVISALIERWEGLLDLTELGSPSYNLREILLEDLDFEWLFDPELDGIENDPIAHKSSGIMVSPIVEWFVPFNPTRVVHPFAAEPSSVVPVLYDLTLTDSAGCKTITLPSPVGQLAPDIAGFEPVSDAVALARQHARTTVPAAWVPDESDPQGSFADFVARDGASGILTHQTGPEGDITQVPVLSFKLDVAHPASGQSWAEVMYFAGRTELPMGAVVAFVADPSVRQRWQQAFQGSSRP